MLSLDLKEFPLLETDRLILREVNYGDVEAIYNLRNHPQTVEFTARPPYQSMDEAKEMITNILKANANGDGISWSICMHGSNEMIGGIGFWRLVKEHYRAEIGYSLLSNFWNQGIISEALIKVCDFGFEHLNLHSIEANLNPDNIGSIKVLERAGFVKEGYFTENYFSNGFFLDTLTYGKVKPG